MIYTIDSTFIAVVENLKNVVSSSINKASAAVDFTSLKINVLDPLETMASNLDTTWQTMQDVIATGNQLGLDLASLIALSAALTQSNNIILTNSGLGTLSDTLADLNSNPHSIPGISTDSWILAQKIDFYLSANEIRTSAINSPNTSEILNNMRLSPNLSDFAVTIRNVKSNAITSALEKIKESTAGIS